MSAKKTRKTAAKTAKAAPHPTRIDLPNNARTAVNAILQARLVEAIDLASQLKQAHWTVKGPNFIALHELFDRIHTALQANVDDIAERIAALGGQPHGTVRAAAAASPLPEYRLDLTDGRGHCEAVAGALAAFAKSVRGAIAEVDEIDDDGTEDLLTGISREIDKHLWFVEAHLQAAK